MCFFTSGTTSIQEKNDGPTGQQVGPVRKGLVHRLDAQAKKRSQGTGCHRSSIKTKKTKGRRGKKEVAPELTKERWVSLRQGGTGQKKTKGRNQYKKARRSTWDRTFGQDGKT